MTTTDTSNPADGAVPPELPPWTIAQLAAQLTDVMSDADDLPQPRYISIHECSQSISLQFAPVTASLEALTRWALRFGAVLTSQPHEDEHGLRTLCRVKFDYYGVPVDAYAFIPAETAST